MLFSQSGQEVCNIINKIGHLPDLIITNSKNVCNDLKWLIRQNNINKADLEVIYIDNSKKITSDFYRKYFKCDDIITLHGWLKIIPADICDDFMIYNGHPGLITDFPELKGKDPQEKAFNLKLPYSGCVIHKVTAEVDGGEVIKEARYDFYDGITLSDVYNSLHRLSGQLWVNFLKERVYA
jgi:folate-dependent phosphoribosylglycinamide formyltransferase PurN